MKLKISNLLEAAKELQKEEENENNWLKMNNLFISFVQLNEMDFVSVYDELHEFVIRCVLSDRSRLSGSALEFLKMCVNKAGQELTHTDQVIETCFKLCNKANRIYNKRGEELLILASAKTNFQKNIGILKRYVQSVNKKVRKAVFLSIESSIKESNDQPKYLNFYQNLIQLGQKDADLESRTICKRILKMATAVQGLSTSFSIGKTEKQEKKEVKSNFPFLSRAPVRSNITGKPQEQEVRPVFTNYLKRTVSDIKKIFEPKNISPKAVATPPKKQVKVSNVEKRKIQLENQKIPPNAFNYTPKTLNRYLDKYREDVRRLKISPLRNNEDQKEEKKHSIPINLWKENDNLFMKEFPESENIQIPDTFELSFEEPKTVKKDEDQVTNIKEEIRSEEKKVESNLVELISQPESKEKEIKTVIQQDLTKNSIKKDQIAKEDQINHVIESKNTIHADLKDFEADIKNKEPVFIEQEKLEKIRSSQKFTEIENPFQDLSSRKSMDVNTSQMMNYFEGSAATSYNNDPTFVSKQMMQETKKEDTTSTLQVFETGNVTFEGLGSLEDTPREKDEKSVNEIEKQKEVTFAQLIDKHENKSQGNIEVNTQEKGFYSDDSSRKEQISEKLPQKTTNDENQKATMSIKGVKISKYVSSGPPLKEKKIEDNQSVNQSNHTSESPNPTEFAHGEFSVTINLQNDGEKNIDKSEVPNLKSPELSKIIESSPVEKISKPIYQELEELDPERFSFLEDSFNSLSVGQDIERVNNRNDTETSSNSSFENSNIKNRLNDTLNEEIIKSRSQIGDFSELGTILQFNKNIFKRE